MDKMKEAAMEIELEGRTVGFIVTYSKRKTIKIMIEAPGELKISAPTRIKEDVLLKNIRTKGNWILSKLSEVEKMESLRVNHFYGDGDKFIYLGKEYPFLVNRNIALKKPVIRLEENRFAAEAAEISAEKLRDAMEKWFRERTLVHVMERIEFYQKYFSVSPTSIKVKEQKKRWASCTSKRGILFNWRCSMAPVSVIDYIVVHEMCHMVYMNHSKEFWNLVEFIMPDYKERKKWLKENGFKMIL